ncbi:MAG: hypothetical protein WCI02_09260, partial [Planctomycetota bacterium]
MPSKRMEATTGGNVPAVGWIQVYMSVPGFAIGGKRRQLGRPHGRSPNSVPNLGRWTFVGHLVDFEFEHAI